MRRADAGSDPQYDLIDEGATRSIDDAGICVDDGRSRLVWDDDRSRVRSCPRRVAERRAGLSGSPAPARVLADRPGREPTPAARGVGRSRIRLGAPGCSLAVRPGPAIAAGVPAPVLRGFLPPRKRRVSRVSRNHAGRRCGRPDPTERTALDNHGARCCGGGWWAGDVESTRSRLRAWGPPCRQGCTHHVGSLTRDAGYRDADLVGNDVESRVAKHAAPPCIPTSPRLFRRGEFAAPA